MNEEATKILDQILKTEIIALKPWEIAFLQARRSYLTKKQQKIYGEVLKATIKPEKPAIDLTKIPYKELQRKAKSYNLPYVGRSREELEQAIRTIEGPEYFKKTT